MSKCHIIRNHMSHGRGSYAFNHREHGEEIRLRTDNSAVLQEFDLQ